MKHLFKLWVCLAFCISFAFSLALEGFTQDPNLHEQSKDFVWGNDIDVHINAPDKNTLKKHKKTIICFYACPAGNTIDWTKGKKMEAGDNWHYDIQHIGAQTRFLRKVLKNKNLIVIYIQPRYWAWQLYDDKHPDNYIDLIRKMMDELLQPFKKLNYTVSLNGHSAGGSWILRYLQGIDVIPDRIDRIAFMDSNYNYKYDAGHFDSLMYDFISKRDDTYLCVMAYNDSVALYKGKPVVSAQGGTWWNSKLMLKRWNMYVSFQEERTGEIIRFTAFQKRLQILLKENPEREILHTVQVYRNGFIHSILSGTEFDEQGYKYYGESAYLDFIK